MLQVAEQLGLSAEVRRELHRTVVVSVGPTTSEMLRDHDLPVDVEPEHPKMGPMVAAAAEAAQGLLAQKRQPGSPDHRARFTASAASLESPLDKNAAWYDSPFMKACRRNRPTSRRSG